MKRCHFVLYKLHSNRKDWDDKVESLTAEVVAGGIPQKHSLCIQECSNNLVDGLLLYTLLLAHTVQDTGNKKFRNKSKVFHQIHLKTAM